VLARKLGALQRMLELGSIFPVVLRSKPVEQVKDRIDERARHGGESSLPTVRVG
jgi:hypothetical protein